MAIKKFEPASHQVLGEYEVAEATNICDFPGIRQCFAIIGMASNKMLCTHVSPGMTKSDMDTLFAHFKSMGGCGVMYWYVLGPCQIHYSFSGSLWKSDSDIKKAFKKYLNNKAAIYLILDATAERNTKRMFPNVDVPMTISSIDIRAVCRGNTLALSYKEGIASVTNWTEFDLAKFRRF